jgi:hypothetical protein
MAKPKPIAEEKAFSLSHIALAYCGSIAPSSMSSCPQMLTASSDEEAAASRRIPAL